jgi:hypothetical protein
MKDFVAVICVPKSVSKNVHLSVLRSATLDMIVVITVICYVIMNVIGIVSDVIVKINIIE